MKSRVLVHKRTKGACRVLGDAEGEQAGADDGGAAGTDPGVVLGDRGVVGGARMVPGGV